MELAVVLGLDPVGVGGLSVIGSGDEYVGQRCLCCNLAKLRRVGKIGCREGSYFGGLPQFFTERRTNRSDLC